MNKTEARFSTTSIPQVAFLLWKGLLPDQLETRMSHNLFLYFGEDDYIGTTRRYWEGDYVPACEMGSCVYLVQRTIDKGYVDKKFLVSELECINDYREWYACGAVEGDYTIGDEDFDYFDIIEKLVEEEKHV